MSYQLQRTEKPFNGFKFTATKLNSTQGSDMKTEFTISEIEQFTFLIGSIDKELQGVDSVSAIEDVVNLKFLEFRKQNIYNIDKFAKVVSIVDKNGNEKLCLHAVLSIPNKNSNIDFILEL